MLFNSLHFLLFFPAVAAMYFICPFRYRQILLLASSYFFYMCLNVNYALLLVVSTLITYLTALVMGISKYKKQRLYYLLTSLILNIGMLAAFKYFNFINDSLRLLCNYFNIVYTVPRLDILLPIGISFYVFKALSYSIDVYRGTKTPEKSLVTYALYVSFFPQLLAGPIERSTHLIPQLSRLYHFNYNRITEGLRLMAWGFFKKVVIADRLALIVNHVYDNPYSYEGVPLIIATFFFTLQIYCDFSSYSDIAIGALKILGINSRLNFNRPYFSKSLTEFWKRWHISLSTWFRDYLYISLGGNRVKRWRWYANLFIVFLVSGLWHGANWTFVLWGCLHGIYLLFGIWSKNLRDKIAHATGITKLPYLYNFLKIVTTFSLVSFAWIFFRANNVYEAYYITTHLFSGLGEFLANSMDLAYLHSILGQLGVSRNELILAFLFIGVLETVQYIQEYTNITDTFSIQPVWFRWTTYYILTAMILFYGAFNTTQEFIYFQF